MTLLRLKDQSLNIHQFSNYRTYQFLERAKHNYIFVDFRSQKTRGGWKYTYKHVKSSSSKVADNSYVTCVSLACRMQVIASELYYRIVCYLSDSKK